MARGRWLIKSEPSTYSFDRLTSEGKATWDGVRNYEARNNLRAMKKGDLCLFYHSTEGKAVVGVAKVTREAFQDPTTEDDFSAVEIAPVRPFARPVTLDEMRADKVLGKMMVFRKPRLSVVPVTDQEFEVVEALGKRKA